MVSIHVTFAMAVSIAIMARALHLYRGDLTLPASLQTAVQVVGVCAVATTVLAIVLLAGEVRAWDL